MSPSDSDSPFSEFKPKPCFTHLPWFLKQRIVDNTDLITRLRLRKVSKPLRQYVENSPFNVKRIVFLLNESKIVVELTTEEETYLTYRKSDTVECIQGDGFLITRPDYLQRAVKDLATLFRNSKMTVGEFYYGYERDNKEYITSVQYQMDQALFRLTFKEEFDKLHHKVYMNTLATIGSTKDDEKIIMAYLKPEALKNLYHIASNSEGQFLDRVRLTRNSEMEPWRVIDESEEIE